MACWGGGSRLCFSFNDQRPDLWMSMLVSDLFLFFELTLTIFHKVLKKSAKKNLVSNCHTKNFTKSKIMTKVEKVPMFEGVVFCFKIICMPHFCVRFKYIGSRLFVLFCVTLNCKIHSETRRAPKNVDISTSTIFLFVLHALVSIHVRTNLIHAMNED